MKVGLLIQARMSSARLPGKTLRMIAGRPLLGHLLERMKKCTRLDCMAVATSDDASDDPIAAFCESQHFPCHRGALHDVAGRLIAVADRLGLTAFVRISGDSPLLLPSLIDHAVDLYQAEPGAIDLVTNIMPRTFPSGESVELIHLETFRQALAKTDDADDHEHVTPLYYREPAQFRIRNFSAPMDCDQVRLVVDTEEDFAIMQQMLERVAQLEQEPTLAQLVLLYRELTAAKGKV